MHVMKKGILYAVLASVLWAIVNPFIKQGLSYDFSPMNFAGLRFTVVGIILFAYTWHRGMWREIMQHRRLFGNLILINMFMGYTAFYFGVDFVSGAISSIVMGLTPLINVLLAHLVASNDRLNRYKVVSLAVSLAGLLLIVGTGSDGSPLDWRGIGLSKQNRKRLKKIVIGGHSKGGNLAVYAASCADTKMKSLPCNRPYTAT